MNLDVQFKDARLHALLNLGNGLVVDRGTDLLKEEREQAPAAMLPMRCSMFSLK